jgi:Holliday junction resolvase-like predicted endonuclease
MSIEQKLLISILKLTTGGSVSHELINKDANAPSRTTEKLLEKLQNNGLIYLRGSRVEIDALQRVKLAVRAIELGADLEGVSGFLEWREFESIAAIASERNGYSVTRNLRFKHKGRRWEIDIIACKKPLALCIDCKHWHHGMHPSNLKKVAEEQVERTKALVDSLPNPKIRINCVSWDTIVFIPAILSLVVPRFKFHENVPIAPILQLQDFLNQLPAYANTLKHFQKRLTY